MSILRRSFCVSGTMSRPRKEIHELIRTNGGIVHETVKSGTDYLVVGTAVGATKLLRARNLGTEILEEDEFLDMLDMDE